MVFGVCFLRGKKNYCGFDLVDYIYWVFFGDFW